MNDEIKVTGSMVNDYFVCPRRLWIHAHHISSPDNEDLKLGALLDEKCYDNRSEKHVMIDNVINIDIIDDWKTVHEVKKSQSSKEASMWQLKYYIYYLRKKGIDIKKGFLNYPTSREKEEVFLTEEDKKRMPEIIADIRKTVSAEKPVSIEEANISRNFCKKCSLYEYCYV